MLLLCQERSDAAILHCVTPCRYAYSAKKPPPCFSLIRPRHPFAPRQGHSLRLMQNSARASQTAQLCREDPARGHDAAMLFWRISPPSRWKFDVNVSRELITETVIEAGRPASRIKFQQAIRRSASPGCTARKHPGCVSAFLFRLWQPVMAVVKITGRMAAFLTRFSSFDSAHQNCTEQRC
jgi:hypothetical protein